MYAIPFWIKSEAISRNYDKTSADDICRQAKYQNGIKGGRVTFFLAANGTASQYFLKEKQCYLIILTQINPCSTKGARVTLFGVRQE